MDKVAAAGAGAGNPWLTGVSLLSSFGGASQPANSSTGAISLGGINFGPKVDPVLLWAALGLAAVFIIKKGK